ncbi:hypothetical protein GPJ56_009630 [Histomonas meleagridis]|uniref:uncharacterized protein n=1 Tax=Histomonas meleagridis TaxID=135588 RepID=UPI00355AB95A|nr:hypothetical protein GPJ56_009630 [Histomonas meleagridis]KAH0804369.1 hypothetical protein GO595_003199 [Histomonas meleagridis]
MIHKKNQVKRTSFNRKPLPDLKTVPDVAFNQRLEMKKKLNMVSQTTLSITEKNQLLQELYELWKKQSADFEGVVKYNELKKSELDNLQKINSDLIEKTNSLRKNTEFLKVADEFLAQHPEQSIIDKIRQTEAELQSIDPQNRPHKRHPIKKENISDIEYHFSLIDTNLQLIEEEAYSYKKRLLAVEQSQESTTDVTKNFGSVNDLINEVKSLEAENLQLKEFEKSLMNDSFTKRRKFSSFSPLINRQISSVFTHEIFTEKQILESLCDIFGYSKPEPPTDEQDFSSICNDPGFDTPPDSFELSDFGNSVEPEEVENLIKSNSQSEKIEILKRITSKLESTNSKLYDEILELRSNQVPKTSTSHIPRLEKMSNENFKLLEKISQYHDNLNSTYTEICELKDRIIHFSDLKSLTTIMYNKILKSYVELSFNHIQCTQSNARNKSILETLISFACTFGLNLLTDEMNENPLNNYFHNHEKISSSSSSCSSSKEKKIEFSKEAENVTTLASRFIRATPKQRKHHLSGPPSTSKFKHPLHDEMKLTKPEIIDMLMLIMKYGGFVFGYDNEEYDKIHKMLKEILNDTSKCAKESIGKFEQFMFEKIDVMSRLAKDVLVKEKVEAEAQTEANLYAEEEVQTMEVRNIKSQKKKRT